MKKLLGVLFIVLCLLCSCGTPASVSGENVHTPQKQDYETYGLNFTQEEIQSAIAVAQAYYSDMVSQDPNPSLYYPEEIEDLESWFGWLTQGVEITYDQDAAYSQIMASSVKQDIEQRGPGTVILLQVTVPAAPENDPTRQRVIELNRDTSQDPWTVRTEGPI